jgi:hypothetical protein
MMRRHGAQAETVGSAWRWLIVKARVCLQVVTTGHARGHRRHGGALMRSPSVAVRLSRYRTLRRAVLR